MESLAINFVYFSLLSINNKSCLRLGETQILMFPMNLMVLEVKL